jgi:hypothetical protein
VTSPSVTACVCSKEAGDTLLARQKQDGGEAAGIIQTGKKCGCRNAARIENLTSSQNSSPISWPADKRFNPLPPSSLQCPANVRALAAANTGDTDIYIYIYIYIYILYATEKIIFIIRITLHEPGRRVPAAPRRDSYTYTADGRACPSSKSSSSQEAHRVHWSEPRSLLLATTSNHWVHELALQLQRRRGQKSQFLWAGNEATPHHFLLLVL